MCRFGCSEPDFDFVVIYLKEWLFISIINLKGIRFDRLTVIDRAEDHISPGGRRYVKWRCLCDCGNIIEVLSDNLRRGKTSSCGCYKRELLSQKQSTHKQTNTKLYGIWCSMKSRCCNRNSHAYSDYGGRGINVCDSWKDNFESFMEWSLLNGYKEGLSIDRVDNNGDYEPSNCRWVGRVAQANNRRSNRLFTFNNETHNIGEWSKIYNIPYKKLYQRLGSGWDISRALTT